VEGEPVTPFGIGEPNYWDRLHADERTQLRKNRLTNFSDFDLIAPIQRTLTEEGYREPTPVQARTLSPAIEGRDVLGIAQTGTGKTAAFALPILNWLGSEPCKAMPKRPFALILAPTRELAIQIGDSLATYGRHLPLRACTIYGGVGQGKQVNQLKRGAHILVATPGRLLDLMSQGHVHLNELETFVLDEADRMLDMGFLPALKRILRELPEERQSLFFSATLPPSIKSFAEQLLYKPVTVRIAPKSVSVEKIDQRFVLLAKNEKRHALKKLLAEDDVDRAIVFTKTKRGANRLTQHLEKSGVLAVAIHGNKSQSARQKALAAFRDNKVQVLVATDVAARGIDIPGVSHVVNFDLPREPESYVHRIGRTGRAGAEGVAISFCLPEEKRELRAIEKLIGKKANVTMPAGGKESPKSNKPSNKSASKPGRKTSNKPGKKKSESGQASSKRKRRTPAKAKAATDKPKRNKRRKRKSASKNRTKSVAAVDDAKTSENRKGAHHRKKQQHLSEEETRDGKKAQSPSQTRKTRGKKKTRKRAVSHS